MITVFTPTYNRAHTLPRLYESLIRQDSKDFEWVIVDDGSSDDTEVIVNRWVQEKLIHIRYYKQENAGKPTAHNKGVVEAKGELFTCVDSDDFLTDNAISTIINTWECVTSPYIIGILAFKIHTDQTPVTKIRDTTIAESTLRSAYKQHGLSGDTMLIFKTETIKKYQFPRIENEKFIPESYLYNKLDREGKLFILRKGLYVCEYLTDGYSKNVDKLLYNNYKSYAFHIKERLLTVDRGFDILLDSIRYASVLLAHKEKRIVRQSAYPIITLIALLPAYILAKRRYGKFL